jgi:hypothetical protein
VARPPPSPASRGVVLDAGAFIGVERRSGLATKLLGRLVRANIRLVTSGAVVAQIWRGGTGRQAPVAMLLSQVEVMALGGTAAKLVGMMLGACGAKDPADGHVVLLARERGWPVLTADEADLRAIDPNIEIVRV